MVVMEFCRNLSDINCIYVRVVAVCFVLTLFCSCATQDSIRPSLPANASMNTWAGRGDHLFIELHSESGQKFVFAMDTGCPGTILDKSQEPALGKSIGKQRIPYGWVKSVYANKYKSPKLFLGQTELLLGDHVLTDDVKPKIGRPVAGILGMDCLSHYCIQLDFESRTIRFFDPDHLNVEGLGKAFPLSDYFWDLSTRADAFGLHNLRFFPDTGDHEDGALKPKLWKQQLPGKTPAKLGKIENLNGSLRREIFLPEVLFGGETYTNVVMKDCSVGNTPDENLLGLRFLARNLVTFNFPKQTMYLKPISVGPLPDANASTNSLTYRAAKFLEDLKKQGQLPGWLKNERGWLKEDGAGEISFGMPAESDADIYNFKKTFIVEKTGDQSEYFYTVVRASKANDWKLEKSWRINSDGKIIENYPTNNTPQTDQHFPAP